MVDFQGMRSTFPEVVDGADLSLPEQGSLFKQCPSRIPKRLDPASAGFFLELPYIA
jgi:hypothetical protein